MSSIPVNNDAPVRFSGFDIDASTSLQFMYAKLQLAQAKQMKSQAVEIMKTIQNTQALQKKTAEMIAKARELGEKAASDKKDIGMPADLAEFCKEHNIPTGSKNSKEGWDFRIKSLSNFQDMLGNDTQTKMVYLQDYIGQYNSMLQGASQQITNSNQTMSTILRNS